MNRECVVVVGSTNYNQRYINAIKSTFEFAGSSCDVVFVFSGNAASNMEEEGRVIIVTADRRNPTHLSTNSDEPIVKTVSNTKPHCVIGSIVERNVRGRSLILIALDEEPLDWDLAPMLTFYCGQERMTRRRRNLIPLIGHGWAAIKNVIAILPNIREDFVRFGELPRFTKLSIEFYDNPGSASRVHGLAMQVANELSHQFPFVATIFGSGFPYYVQTAESSFQATPDSIKRFVRARAKFIDSQICSGNVLNSCNRVEFASERGVLGFDSDKMSDEANRRREINDGKTTPRCRRGQQRPARKQFEIAEDIWPCQLCTIFNDPYLTKCRTPSRGFNEECLGCMQTSLGERAVMDSAADVDLIVSVDELTMEKASQIEAFLRQHNDYYIPDTKVAATIRKFEIAVDLFLVDKQRLARTLNAIASSVYPENVEIEALALWLPQKKLSLPLGAHLPIAFEVIRNNSESIHELLRDARRNFGMQRCPMETIEALRRKSFYHTQILSNQVVVDTVLARLSRWACNH